MDSDDTHKSLVCQWEGCTDVFDDAEVLFTHLTDVHVGRKSSGNLSLTCRWRGCTVTCAKRDHITSHMRVHTPLKPHACPTCSKAFKRPQDLRKHEKIHTEEHHHRHKQSKAITVPSTSAKEATHASTIAHHSHGSTAANGAPFKPHELAAAAANMLSAGPHSHQQSTPGAHHQQQQHNNPYMPYVLPYPYPYPILPEQQASLAELLMQQQRLNAAAAQLMGLPPHVQQAAAAAAAATLQHQGGLPYAPHMFVPSVFPQGSYGHTPSSVNYPTPPSTHQQQLSSPTAVQSFHNHTQPPPQHNTPLTAIPQPNMQTTTQPRTTTAQALYPSLYDLETENKPIINTSNTDRHSRASSSAGASPASSSAPFSSVSPMPVYANALQQPALSYGSQTTSAASSVTGDKLPSTVLGKNKRAFNDEADALLNEIKKKKFDPNDTSSFDTRIDSLSAYLFGDDPSSQPQLYGTSANSMPSLGLSSTLSASDGSSHSSANSNASPPSTSVGVTSPVEVSLDMSKNDIDDINSLLFSFGQPYDSPSAQDALLAADMHHYPFAHSNSTNTFASSVTTNLPFSQDTKVPLSAPPSSSLYPSLSGLQSSKPIKPLPGSGSQPARHAYSTHNTSSQAQSAPTVPHSAPPVPSPNEQHAGYGSLSMGLPHVAPQHSYNGYDYVAPSRSIPTPYIAADYHRDPAFTRIQLLSRAPPSSLRHILDDDTSIEQSSRSKQGVSSIRSTARDDQRDSPEAMSEDERDEAEAHRIQHAARQERITLAPIDHPETGARLASLPSLLSDITDPVAPPMSESDSSMKESSPPLSSSSSSSSPHSSASHKRSTPSRQFYPSLPSASAHERSWSHSSDSTRPTTGERIAHITHGVGSFRMSSIDDYEPSDSRSDSEDDTADNAVYKRSRMRTQSPVPEDDATDDEESDETATKRQVVTRPEADLRVRRLAVIRALVSRANELYRTCLQKKAGKPALERVKEEIVD